MINEYAGRRQNTQRIDGGTQDYLLLVARCRALGWTPEIQVNTVGRRDWVTVPLTDAIGQARTATTRKYLLCPPEYFAVYYAINPWMDPQRPVDAALAMTQWDELRKTF